ncbi:MAG: UDP-N-acetylmuramate dehydrogenase [Pseudomonadota bacterium]
MTSTTPMIIDPALREQWHAQFGDTLAFDVPMSAHTSWRVGGLAQVLFQPRSLESLSQFVRELPAQIPLHWVGLGSNLLVRDGGVAGVVVTTKKLPHDIAQDAQGDVVASAGTPCTTLARQLVRWGLGPSEFFAGIPGSLGGALTMNAGAHGHETWDVVRFARLLHRDGRIRQYTPGDFKIAYRSVVLPAQGWFVGATLRFDPDYEPSLQHMRELQDRRKQTQPLGLPSCGSVFRNPDGDHAARLIEVAGLKGHQIGGAQVSPKHANFIINTGAATAADIEALITHVQDTVSQHHSVALTHEVRFLGEAVA